MLIVNTLGQYLKKTILKGPYWVFRALGFIIFFAICLNLGFDLKRWAYFKNFVAMVSGGHVNLQLCCYYWSDVAYQTTDMLMQRLQVWDTVHQANMRFRVLLPFLWLLFHSAIAIYFLQIILGIGQLYMIIRIIYRITQDRLQAFYFTLGFAGLYSGAAFYLDFYGFGDAFAYTFMTAAVFFRKPFWIALSVFLAALVDERALLNTSFIVLFHWIISNKYDWKKLNLRLFQLPMQAWAVLLGGLIYMSVRVYLTFHFQLKTPYGGPSPFFFLREASKSFGIRLWTGFESFWILILMMLFFLYYRRDYILFYAVCILTGITVFTFLLQGDHTRTAAYGFPLFFSAMVIIKQELHQEELQATLLLISLLSIIFFPVYY